MNAGAFTWESHRREDGTLDLISALIARCPQHNNPQGARAAMQFLDEVEELTPLRSPEAASIALARAFQLVRRR